MLHAAGSTWLESCSCLGFVDRLGMSGVDWMAGFVTYVAVGSFDTIVVGNVGQIVPKLVPVLLMECLVLLHHQLVLTFLILFGFR